MKPFYAPPVSRRWLRTTTLLIAMLLLQSPALGDIYKWTDKTGEVQYTQTPPPGGITTQKIQGAPPPAESQETIHEDQKRLQERLEAFEERRARQEEDEAIKKKDSEINEKNCITAENNLAKLQKGGIKRYLTPEGEVIRLTEEDRQRRITEANNQVKQYCNP
ncbi:MAG: DUF4124 domain-containing protein [Pseudomonadota bacterium]